MQTNCNSIKGGCRGDDVSVFCDGIDIYEISHDVANAFGWSWDYNWSWPIYNLRCDEDKQKYLKETFPNLSDEAYRAILDATIRGLTVSIVSKDEKRKEKTYKKICEYNHLASCFSMLSASKQKKILKLLGKEGYEWFR